MKVSLFFLLLTGCAASTQIQDSLTLIVTSRPLETSSCVSFLKSCLRSPEGDMGHAWIHLQGTLEGKKIDIEGGHSGERGILEPKFFEGVTNLAQRGTVDSHSFKSGQDPNPIRYLFSDLHDGFFQKGSGGFKATYALRVPLTKEELKAIYAFIQPSHYHFSKYNLSHHQCTSFVKEVATFIGVYLDDTVLIPIPASIRIGSKILTLWNDPRYDAIPVGIPNRLEESLRAYHDQGEEVTSQYQRSSFHPLSGFIKAPNRWNRRKLYNALRDV